MLSHALRMNPVEGRVEATRAVRHFRRVSRSPEQRSCPTIAEMSGSTNVSSVSSKMRNQATITRRILWFSQQAQRQVNGPDLARPHRERGWSARAGPAARDWPRGERVAGRSRRSAVRQRPEKQVPQIKTIPSFCLTLSKGRAEKNPQHPAGPGGMGYPTSANGSSPRCAAGKVTVPSMRSSHTACGKLMKEL